MNLLKLVWRKLRRRQPQTVSSQIQVKIEGGRFLETAVEGALDEATRIIEKRIREVSPFPVRTGGLRQSISFGPRYLGCSGTHRRSYHYSSLPTGTINPWGLGVGADYAQERPILGRRSYIDAWPCPWCDRLNGAQLIACADCGGSKDTGNLPIRSIPRDWRCSWCWTGNQTDPFKCGKCGGRRTLISGSSPVGHRGLAGLDDNDHM